MEFGSPPSLLCCCSGCVDALHFSPIDWSDGGGGVPGARSPLNDLTGLVFLRYCLLCSPPPASSHLPSGSSAGPGRGRGPLQAQVQHEDAGSRTPCEGDAGHPASRPHGETHVQGEVHPPGAQHVGLLCGQGEQVGSVSSLKWSWSHD